MVKQLVPQFLSSNNVLLTWSSMAVGDTGQIATQSYTADRSVQVVGTFGAGGSVQLEGSHDQVNWFVLKDTFGSPLTFTSPGLRQVLEHVPFMRPNVTIGDGTTALNLSINLRTSQ